MPDWRTKLRPAPDAKTTAWRVFNDARAGVWIDEFDGRWLVQTRKDSFPDWIREAVPEFATSVYWKPRTQDASSSPTHLAGEVVSSRFEAKEADTRFWVDFGAGYSSGIFLDQRLNRKHVAKSVSEGDRILNCFSYTSVFSVAAARAGAITSSLDLSQTYLDWSKDNFRLNEIDPETQFFCRGDVFEWMRTFARQGRKFHGVILDPPTFSRNKKQTFRTDRDYAGLAALATELVEPGGWMICCANTHRMEPADFQIQVEKGIRDADREAESIKSMRMPPEFVGEDYLKSLKVVVR